LLALWEAVIFASSVVRRFDLEGSMLPGIEHVFRGFGARQVPYFSIASVPAKPTSLRGFLAASIKHRWNRVRRRIAAPATGSNASGIG
jgi:hypothetical protein